MDEEETGKQFELFRDELQSGIKILREEVQKLPLKQAVDKIKDARGALMEIKKMLESESTSTTDDRVRKNAQRHLDEVNVTIDAIDEIMRWSASA